MRAALGLGLLALALATAGSAGAVGPKTGRLPVLVVPRSGLGDAARGLSVELGSGLTSNARAAADSYDPTDNPASVGAAGRIVGYLLFYGDPGLESLRRGSGLLELGTSVDLFRTAAQAQAFEDKSLRDVRRARGVDVGGSVVERVATFPVQALGSWSQGVRTVERVGRKRIYSTLVDFRVGPLLAEAAVRRADATSTDAQTVAIARTLAARIASDARGTLKAVPVTLPRPLGTARPGPRAPKLDQMVLTNASFKGKGIVTGQGYEPDDTAIASFFREFRFDPSTGMLLARSAAELERSKREAAGRLLILRSELEGPGAAKVLAGIVTGGATSPVLDSRPHSIGAGDESFAASATFNAQGQRLRVVVVDTRVGRTVGTLIVVGTAKGLTAGRGAALGRAQAARMKRAVAGAALTA